MEEYSSFRWTINEMVELIQKWILNFHDVRTTKLIASFGISFFFISCFIGFFALIIMRTPIWKSPVKSNNKLEVSPYIAKNIVKKSNINFLPDTSELRIYDDDKIALDGLPEFRQTRRHQIDYSANEPEALISLRMALHLKEGGKHEKAQKLFQHALALNPVQPDILTHYGEFLEQHHQDVIKADHMYTRALIVCPEHSKALVNRQRTLPVVEELDQKQLTRIDRKRDRLISIPENDPALKRMKKEAYFQHIHHTVAIEGNTMTLAETRMVVETRMAVPGKSIVEHNEILGLESALKYINTTLVNKYGLINVGDILQIHKRVLGHADPLEAGCFRRSQVFVGEHTPPSPTEIIDMMEDFIEWMNSEEAFSLHPVKHAALAHYKLVYIHPFIDGNGRTARLLMNLILMRAGYPPVIIRKQDRSLYYEYLQHANEGDVRPFVRFIAECTERTLDVYLYATEYGISGVRALGGQEIDRFPRIIDNDQQIS